MITIAELEAGNYVIFRNSADRYLVTHVGPKYFHVEIAGGAISGPYSVDLVGEVIKG